MKKIKYLIEYSAVRLCDLFFQLWPRSWALRMGEAVGLLFAWIMPKRRVLVRDNLRQAFPEKTEQEIARIAREMWKNIGRVAGEFVRAPDITSENYTSYFSFEGMEHIERALAQGKGVILVGFHFGNWEYSGIAIQFRTQKSVAIARPMKNPYVERWVQQKRANSDMQIILHRQAVKESLRTLKAKKMIGILVDQNLYTGGTFVHFFGRPAASTTLPALLHSRTEAPVILLYCRRENGRLTLVAEPPIQFPAHPVDADDVVLNTQIISHHVEAVIRKNPEQWFWIHNRWKRKPA